MDGINNINGMQGIQAPTNMQPKQHQDPQEQNSFSTSPPFDTQISSLGQLFSAVQESGEAAQSDLKQFHESLFEALQSGDFDAAALAENASDTIKTIAEEAGIDLEQTLTEFAQNAPHMNGAPPQGPPPGGGAHQGPPPTDDLFTSNSEDEDSESYLDTENTL